MLEQLLQVSACELPFERLADRFVAALDGAQAHGEAFERAEVVWRECLAM